ncbi:alpha-amylase family glycosyl hydrolase [Zhongshania sp.]|jgi:sucrose phosphorylase|uniref:alpha-amylase family glycosyl hydrolase n=1 Tax=Zhongshania sp. TaxID=1971902 RepID=UPI002A81C00B|nr:alpha-amylase family glycosyl hydrolase [Zhongshania sp.]
MTELSPAQHLRNQLAAHVEVLYPHLGNAGLIDDMIAAMALDQRCFMPETHKNHWDENDALVITYGDSILRDGEWPLHTLHDFLRRELLGVVSGVHILPFYPYSSDDGFSVINYVEVNPSLGDWPDVSAIARDFDLMADLVINHCSSRSLWFENFKQRRDPGQDYFVEVDPSVDLSAVVRPRTSPLLSEVQTLDGKRHVWCTFSHDQVDLNFENPKVLLEFIKIIRHYLDMGVKIFRLDAVAFLWKVPGTSSLNLEQTHEAVRLLRSLIEHAVPDAIIITETNIPLRENLAYFGNANEAHMVYNFSLPPLLINTLVTGSSRALKTWMMGMPAAQDGTTYFNFIASHDGIGLRPAEGLLDDEEIKALVGIMQKSGGRVSWRALANGESRPYEINISLFDAMRRRIDDSEDRNSDGEDGYQEQRFICAHALMLAVQGVPAFYIHSLLATENDENRILHTSHNRAINRHQWSADDLEEQLATASHHARIFAVLKDLIKLRAKQPAFHPNAAQYPLHLGDQVFGLRRESHAEGGAGQSLLAIYNISAYAQTLSMSSLNLDADKHWRELLSDIDIHAEAGDILLPPYAYCWLASRP